MIADIILHWNAIALGVVANDFTSSKVASPDQGGPTRTSRALAIVHLSMADAWAGIRGGFQPYQASPPARPVAASHDQAAVTGAAWTTLRELYPSQAADIDAARAAAIAIIGAGPTVIPSLNWGIDVGNALLTSRMADGSSASVAYTPSSAPGHHRADPFSAGQLSRADAGALHPHWGSVKPFAIGPVNAAPFLPAPPPTLGSLDYLAAYDQVKAKGTRDGGNRTDEERVIGLFWGYDGAEKLGTPPRLYNQILRKIAQSRANTPAQNARLFGLANASMADAGIQCWYAKYLYDLWRPVVGIREADPGTGPTGQGDGNPWTKGDTSWEPLGAPRSNPAVPAGFPDWSPSRDFTPPFPAYPSGHATFGAAALGVVRSFYGTDNVPFTFVSDELNGSTLDADRSARPRVERGYATLSQAILENALSRVYLGVHWVFDGTSGVKAGTEVATATFGAILRPTP